MSQKAAYPIYTQPPPEGVDYQPGKNFYRRYENRPSGAQPVLFYHPLRNVWVAIEFIAKKLGLLTLTGLERQTSKKSLSLKPAPITDQMKELGVKASPEGICFPFKAIVGYLLETFKLFEELKTKINLEVYPLVLSHESQGPCRERIYGRLQEARLGDCFLNFDFYIVHESQKGLLDFIWFLASLVTKSRFKLLRFFKRVITAKKAISLLNEAIERLDLVEKFEQETRLTQSLIAGSDFFVAEKILEEVREATANTEVSWAQLTLVLEKSWQKLGEIPRVRGKPIGIIGLTGEIFHCEEIESCSGDIQRESAKRGFLLIREVGIGHYTPRFKVTIGKLIKLFLSRFNPFRRNKAKELAARGGLKRDAGGHSIDTVAILQETRETKEKGKPIYDGVIIVEPFGCQPEIVARNVALPISQKGKIRSHSLIYDEHTSTTGILTRLEAFLDMIRREKVKQNKNSAPSEHLDILRILRDVS